MADDMKQTMIHNMESPLNAQKDAPEHGPAAPSGLPNWPSKDPLGIVPDGAGESHPGHRGRG
jgi:hypothetical protein